MKTFITLLLMFFYALFINANEMYPNELEGFKLYNKYCQGIKPLESTIADVRKCMGTPKKSKIKGFFMDYIKDDWSIIVYICPDNNNYTDRFAGNIIQSIDFIPSKRILLSQKIIPKSFNKHRVICEIKWNEFYDSYGLVYQRNKKVMHFSLCVRFFLPGVPLGA